MYQARQATLGVTGGALSSCTVVQAGIGCGPGTGVTFVVQGGGGERRNSDTDVELAEH